MHWLCGIEFKKKLYELLKKAKYKRLGQRLFLKFQFLCYIQHIIVNSLTYMVKHFTAVSAPQELRQLESRFAVLAKIFTV